MKKLGKKLLSGILSFCMIAGMVISPAVSVKAKEAASGYSVELGSAIWDDESHTTFKYPHVKITGNANQKIYSITVDVENGSASKLEAADVEIPTFGGKGTTYVYDNGKSLAEIEEILKNLQFTSTSADKKNVDITISSNKTSGFTRDNIVSMLYNPANGHYYLRTGKLASWFDSYNTAKTYTFNGRKGYLATYVYNDAEYQFLKNTNFFQQYAVVGASKLKNTSDGSIISDVDSIAAGSFTTATEPSTTGIYYNCGPEAGEVYNPAGIIAGQGDDNWECIVIGFGAPGTYDCRNYHQLGYELIVEFGGYEEKGKKDPGGYEVTNETRVSDSDFTPYDTEAMIGSERYAPLGAAFEAAKTGDTIEIVAGKDTVTPVTEGTLKSGVTIKNGDKEYTAKNADAKIDVAADKTITLKDGTITTTPKAT